MRDRDKAEKERERESPKGKIEREKGIRGEREGRKRDMGSGLG